MQDIPQSKGDLLKEIITSYHFWIIVLINFVFAFLYYGYEYLWDTLRQGLPWLRDLITFEFRNDINGALLYIPFVYSILVFKWRGVLIVWLVSIAIAFPHIISFSPDGISLRNNIIVLLAPLAVFTIITLEMKWRNREKRILAQRNAERGAYLSQVFKAQEVERQHIALELHDEVAQKLLVISNRAQSLLNSYKNKSDPIIFNNDLGWIRDNLIETLGVVRKLSISLRPTILDNMGLIAALRWRVDQLNSNDLINAHLYVTGAARKLPQEMEIHIFRIVQEALNNVERHSGASIVKVFLKYTPDKVTLAVEDNGMGFRISEILSKLTVEGKLGIMGIKERAKAIGSVAEVHSKVGEGTKISLTIKV